MENVQDPLPKASTTQIGAITEALVAAQLMLVSGGRLSVYRPMADDDGVDLLVLDKETGAVHPVQVKTWRSSEADAPGTLQFDTRIATLNEARGGYLLAAALDPQTGAIWRIWMIPLSELRSVSNERRGVLAISPSPSTRSRDRYSLWRLSSIHEAAQRLMRQPPRTGAGDPGPEDRMPVLS